ncbi:MAG: SAM-dependent methyltransferase, partial [Chloroflexota bacterium]
MMKTKAITLLGLGPGDPQLITRQAWDILNTVPEIYLQSSRNPLADQLPAALQVNVFDHLFEADAQTIDIYQQIAEQVLILGSRPEGVVYAVPGHPLIANPDCAVILRAAREGGIPVRVIEGLSFLGPVCSALGIDPLPHTGLIDALTLASAHHPDFPPDQPVLIYQVAHPQIAAGVKAALLATYPTDHRIQLVHAPGTDQQLIEELPLGELDSSQHFGPLTTLYLPPLGPATSLEAFQEIIAHLRAPDGCPWDREQTHQSLRPNLLEETYELAAAL